jgi:Mg-chelatase subunit ChlD
MMNFLNPQLLHLALPAAIITAAVLVWLNYWRRKVVQKRVGEWELLADTSKPLPAWRYAARALFAGLTAASLIIALARPIIPNGSKMIAEGTVDVVAAVDVSRSMAAMDYEGKVPQSAVAKPLLNMTVKSKVPVSDEPGSRLEMVRHVILDHMLGALKNNQFGVVSFAGKAFPQAFLSRDTDALRWVIDRGLTINSAPDEGSALAKALDLSLDMFDADSPPDHEKLLILFSDGGNDDKAADLLKVTKEIRARHIKFIVVALGNLLPSQIPVSKLAADDDYAQSLRDHGTKWFEVNGEVIKTGMDLTLLQNLANVAGGEVIQMHQASDLNLLSLVGKTRMTPVPGTLELFPEALMCALVFLGLTLVVTKQWRRRKQS